MTTTTLLDNWSPPAGAGAAVACLATSYTFEADFFSEECLARFLSLSNAPGEGDRISSIVTVLEEEERLSEAQVCVLVDRSTPAEKRNLRWDVLQVSAPGGLLHAKVAVLVWERALRVILGSANLTSAGHRRQVEISPVLDVEEGSSLPRSVLDELVVELRRLVDLVPGGAIGPKARSLAVVDLLATRLAAVQLASQQPADLRLALAPARPGLTPLDRLPDVWRGSRPLTATVLSPFWDDEVPAPAVRAVRALLTGLPAADRSVTLVAGIDPFTQTVHAPASLAQQPGATVKTFDPPDKELRRLHAKLLLVESPGWLAALVGSSNATAAGLGLRPLQGHHELNLWIGCPAGSATATQLRALARPGPALTADDSRWAATKDEDEDEATLPSLPSGFVTCTVDAGHPARAQLALDPRGLPVSWSVALPGGDVLLQGGEWRDRGSAAEVTVELAGSTLPPYLLVAWEEGGVGLQATWTANVLDRAALPLPADLTDVPVELLLAALASTRPLPVALGQAMRSRQARGQRPGAPELDPLRRFDGTGLLLHRVRHASLALWRLGERLARPCSSLDSLQWRLNGVVGPMAIADGLVRAAADEEALPGESRFLLAELALTLAAVDWDLAPAVNRGQADALVAHVLDAMSRHLAALPASADQALDDYVLQALAEARR